MRRSAVSDQTRIGAILHKLLSGVAGSNILLLCHKNADPDTLGSAYALAQFFKEHNSATCKIYAESLNKPAERQAQYLQIEILNEIDPNARVFIMLDVNNLKQLGSIATGPFREILLKNPPIIIDHHAPHAEGSQLTSNYFTLDDVPSTCEIIYRVFKYSKTEILPDVAFALLAGIVYDTKHFILALKSTFEATIDLLSCGVEYQEILATLNVPLSFSERMARIKSAQRMEVERIGGYLLTTSHIRAYEAAAARSLVKLGADVAIVFTPKKDDFRISARCTKDFHTETGIHLGKLFEKAAEMIGGMGGGHRTAAGLNANTQTDPKTVRDILRGFLREQILKKNQKKGMVDT